MLGLGFLLEHWRVPLQGGAWLLGTLASSDHGVSRSCSGTRQSSDDAAVGTLASSATRPCLVLALSEQGRAGSWLCRNSGEFRYKAVLGLGFVGTLASSATRRCLASRNTGEFRPAACPGLVAELARVPNGTAECIECFSELWRVPLQDRAWSWLCRNKAVLGLGSVGTLASSATRPCLVLALSEQGRAGSWLCRELWRVPLQDRAWSWLCRNKAVLGLGSVGTLASSATRPCLVLALSEQGRAGSWLCRNSGEFRYKAVLGFSEPWRVPTTACPGLVAELARVPKWRGECIGALLGTLASSATRPCLVLALSEQGGAGSWLVGTRPCWVLALSEPWRVPRAARPRLVAELARVPTRRVGTLASSATGGARSLSEQGGVGTLASSATRPGRS